MMTYRPDVGEFWRGFLVFAAVAVILFVVHTADRRPPED